MDFSNPIVIDTETTGLPGKQKQEVLSLAITDLDGNVLFYDLIKPKERKRWPKAQEIHGISPADVKDKQTLEERLPDIEPIFNSASVVVGYNVKFDIDMLASSGFEYKGATHDLMRSYSNRHNNGRFAKLTQCASHYGYKYDAHNALEDAKATAYCYKKFKEETLHGSKEYNNQGLKQKGYVEQNQINKSSEGWGIVGAIWIVVAVLAFLLFLFILIF